MNETTPQNDIRFFNLTSRIGRLRYIAYGFALGLLTIIPAVIAGILVAFAPMLGFLLVALIYIAYIVISIGFGVRRLHDLDKSGWWMLLMIVPLVNLGLVIYLLFFPGSIGENRFGAQPPPNSTVVIVGAIACIVLTPIGVGIWAAVAIPTMMKYKAQAQSIEAVETAKSGEALAMQYFMDNNAWPKDMATLYGKQGGSLPGDVESMTAVVAPSGAYGIVVTIKSTGKAVEVWTSDNGGSWHCGPANANGIDAASLPESCRESDPSPP